MRTKFCSFLLFPGLLLGIGLFGSIQAVSAQGTDDKKVEKDDDDDKHESPEAQKKLAKQAKISKKDARKIALKRIPGKVIESEIDKEKGKIVWEFEIKTKEGKVFEVLVDAMTGKIVEVEDETDEKGDDDDGDHGGAAAK